MLKFFFRFIVIKLTAAFAALSLSILAGAFYPTASTAAESSGGAETSGEISVIYFMPVGSLSNPFTQMAEVGIKISASLYPQIKAARIYLYFDRHIDNYIKSILAVGDHRYIIGIGSNYAKLFDSLAGAYPDRHFIVIDAKAENPKVKSIEFDNFEAGYMAGAVSAIVTKSRKIGFIGGARDKGILDFEKGFRAAAVKNNPEIKDNQISSEYIAEGVEGYSDAAAGARIADKMYGGGCDVIFAAAGASGLGAIDSAGKSKKYIIGVDSDQDSIAPGAVITSVIKRLDTAIINLAGEIASGGFGGAPVKYNIGNAGLTFSAFKHTKNKIGAKKYNRIFSAVFSK